jgi:polyhydroxyalkanoate synthesis regulator phasin
MSNPILQVLNLGKALTEVLSEKAQDAVTEALSELEKIKAEQTEHVRQLINEVEERANQTTRATSEPTQIIISEPEKDTQEVLDELRAEIACLRAELKNWAEIARLRNELKNYPQNL